MNKRLVLGLIIALLVLTTFLSGCAGTSRIGSFFQNGDYLKHSKIIDFFIFFTLFFSLTYLGFTKWFSGEFGKGGTGKGAVVGLSLALSLALTFAIITQTKFSITSLFPLAKSILFLAVTLLLYGLLNNILKVEGKMSKVLLFIFSLILVYVLFSIFTYFVCMTENNNGDPACRGGPFTWLGKMGQKHIWGSWFSSPLFGSGSSGGSGIIGGSGSGSGVSGGSGKGAAPGTIGPDGQPIPAFQTSGQFFDYFGLKLDGEDGGTSYGTWIFGIVVLLILLGLGYWYWRRRGARQTLEHVNLDIKNLKNRLSQLWQRRAEIVRNRDRALPTATEKQKLTNDYDNLCQVIQNIEFEDAHQRLPMKYGNLFSNILYPQLHPINTYFANPANLDGLEPAERDELHNIVRQEKILEWRLMRTFDWYRMFFRRKLSQINDYERNLQVRNLSPILHSDRTMSIIFRPDIYGGIDGTPEVVFFGAAPAGARAETRDMDSLDPSDRATGNSMEQTGSVWHFDFEVPVPLTRTRYKYVFQFNKEGNIIREYDPQNNLYDPDKKYSVLIA